MLGEGFQEKHRRFGDVMNNNEKKGNKDMWKLTVTQKRKSEFTDGTFNESVEFSHRNIGTLTSLIDNLNNFSNGVETTYKIEKVVEE